MRGGVFLVRDAARAAGRGGPGSRGREDKETKMRGDLSSGRGTRGRTVRVSFRGIAGGTPAVSAFSLALLAGAAFAQTSLVLPQGPGVVGDLRQREGKGGFHLPAGRAPSRVLCVYRGAGVGLGPKGFSIGGIAFRRDSEKTGNFRYHAWKLSVSISSKGVPLPSRMDATSFLRNHGTDRKLVLTAKTVQWPAVGKPPTPPGPFVVRVKLDAPFVWTGGNLCLDLRSDPVSGTKDSSYWYTDAETSTWAANGGSRRTLGRGCPFGYQVWSKLPPLDGETPQVFYAYTRVSSPAAQPALLAIGASDTTWAGLNLPLNLAALGAPGCSLQVGPLVWIAGATIGGDPRGTVLHDLGPLPRTSPLAGGILFVQSAVLEAKANKLGMRFSNHLRATFGKGSAPLAARLLYHSGPTLTDKPTAAKDMGLVVELNP